MLPYVWTDTMLAHQPGAEVYVGLATDASEVPERAVRIRAALDAAGARSLPAHPHEDGRALALHDEEMVAWLRGAYDEWQGSDLVRDPGQDCVVPYLFPHPGLLGDAPARTPAAIAAKAGRWLYDTMTPVGPGTWASARAALDAAITAADLVVGGQERAVYALTRPPGHHATRDGMGGCCYLANAAAAANALRLEGRVALIDVDAHHGNGSQSIFRGDPNVLTGSVHVDPAFGWFPHHLGFATENDEANRNLPLPPGTGDEGWLAAVRELAEWSLGCDALVVALGVDAAAGDAESPLLVSLDGYAEAGRILAGLDLPTVIVQEGGYDLERIGPLVRAFLEGF